MATPPRSDLFSPHLPPPSDRRDSQHGNSRSPRSRDSLHGSGFGNTQSNALEQSLLATRLLGSSERSGFGEIGHPVLPGHQEMFVDSAPAAALQQQFHRLRPEYIAIHELGSAWSRKLLTGIATATGRTLQQLDIRREGTGATLATVDYVECPSTDGGVLRIYSTDVSGGLPTSDSAPDLSGQQIALVLLAYARLGVVMVGNMSMPTMRAAFGPMHQAMQRGPWPSRNLLLLPLTSAGALASIGGDLFADSGVTVRTTPQVMRSADAWSFISGTWNRLREELRHRGGGFAGQSVILPALPGARSAEQPTRQAPEVSAAVASDTVHGAASAPMPLPLPLPAHGPADAPVPFEVAPSTVTPFPDPTALGRFVERVSSLQGLLSCCVFPLPTGREMGDVAWPDLPFYAARGTHPGHTPTAASLTTQGRLWMRSVRHGAEALGMNARTPSAMLTLEECHVLLRPVPNREDLMLIAVFARSDKPMLYELQLRRLEGDFGTLAR